MAIGEAHLKLARAERIGEALARAFDLRGVESFQTRHVLGGRIVMPIIEAPRRLLRAVSFGLVRGSTITYARGLAQGHTALLEVTDHVPLGLHIGTLHLTAFFLAGLGSILFSFVPGAAALAAALTRAASILELHFVLSFLPAWALRDRPWSWVLNPAIAILTVRDVLMARGTVRMLAERPEHRAALVIMGRAHLRGYEHELNARHGFTSVT